MSNINTSLTIELIYQFTQYLDKVKEEHGMILKNQEEIWKRLNHITNEQWLAIIEVMFLLNKQNPDLVHPAHVMNFAFAQSKIEDHAESYDNLLGTTNYTLKDNTLAWDVMLGMYNVWKKATTPEPKKFTLREAFERMGINV